ncbi:receptor for retinol uptake stra6-like isoform X2 [Crassostrea angulata]|uniref:receptor for retinol uptake stra6-like isoform X2 n=1 Tax=Magallana angulata TaxID=2784310 RepID=UPI0022B0CDBD|nr:receptor for retinol uptake stra6-like isoform X2 [Crassostrea angulata]
MAFIEDLLSVFQEFSEDDGNSNFTYTIVYGSCSKVIPHQEFRLYLLIPAAISTVLLAFSTRRTKQKLHLLNGRPGLIFPMDVMKRSHRFSYAAAFGTLAHLCSNIVFDAKYAFNYNGPTYLKGITTESPLGYLVATLFSWIFTAEFFANSFCTQKMNISYLILIIGVLPEMLCYLYLTFSLPVRFVLSIAKPEKKTKLAVDFESSKDLYESVRKSYQGIHVAKLFKRPPPPPPPPEGAKEKLIFLLKNLTGMVFYKRTKGFRYSTRIMSVIAIGFILLCEVTFLLFIVFYQAFEYAEKILNTLQVVEEFLTTTDRKTLHMLLFLVTALRGCFLTSLMVAYTINVVFLLHYMTSYRNNLLLLYKGKNEHLIPMTEKSNASLIVGSMRYAGYQVGYIGWGFFIQFLLLLIISIVIATIVTLWDVIKDLILQQIMILWPVLITSLVLNILQLVLSKFLFLQENGDILAMDNRRLFFIFTYFMFFYNIFIGIFSCLMRIIKAIILGALFLPRLDHSTLPKKFQRMDPGFDAYCGFMHVESTHTNPVAMVFISILQAESLTALKKKEKKILNIVLRDEYQEMLAKKRRKARWKWLLAYTLVNNPEISLQRRLVLAKERNENIKEIFFSHSSSFTVKSTKPDLEDVIIQSERL